MTIVCIKAPKVVGSFLKLFVKKKEKSTQTTTQS